MSRKPQVRRRASAHTKFHMSAKAVSARVVDVSRWSERECIDYFVEARFGSWNTVSCPHCGTIDKHYWRPLEKRWKCSSCGSTFSATSQTVLAGRRLPLNELIAGMLMWMNSASGQPALELKRHMGCAYNTAFTLQHKVREALVRAYNVGLMSGDIEMDAAHQAGRRSAEKRGQTQGSRPSIRNEGAPLTAAALTQTGKSAARKKLKDSGGVIDPDYRRRLPADRRMLISMRQRSGVKGMGACRTKVAIGLMESQEVIESILEQYVGIGESILNTDTCPAYSAIGKRFLAHRTVEHSKTFSGPNGENNNQAEEYNWRYDRLEKGIHLNVEPKYLLDYAVETAFRSDTRRMSNGEQLKLALHLSLNIGMSMYWRGFTHGRHRSVELLSPAPQPAPSSGPRKKAHPAASASGLTVL